MFRILALLADIANALFALVFASIVTGTALQWWHLFIAIPFALLPDIDAVYELYRRGRVSASAVHQKDHRTFLHYPVFAIPLAILAGATGGYWGLVLGIAIVLHLANDLYGTGWGLALFWPLKTAHYKLCNRRANRLRSLLVRDGDWDVLTSDERRLRPIVSWSAEELPGYISRWGVDDWIPLWYQELTWVSVVEYTLFLFALSLFVTQLM